MNTQEINIIVSANANSIRMKIASTTLDSSLAIIPWVIAFVQEQNAPLGDTIYNALVNLNCGGVELMLAKWFKIYNTN